VANVVATDKPLFSIFCEMMIIGGTLSYCRSFEDLVYHVQVLILLGPKYGTFLASLAEFMDGFGSGKSPNA